MFSNSSSFIIIFQIHSDITKQNNSTVHLVTDETVDVPGAQVGVGVQLVHDPVGHPLLVDLSVVDLLLQGIVCHKTVDVSLLLLTISRIKSIIIMNESIRFQ